MSISCAVRDTFSVLLRVLRKSYKDTVISLYYLLRPILSNLHYMGAFKCCRFQEANCKENTENLWRTG